MLYNKLLFNRVISKCHTYVCDGCAHYLKEHRVCGIFKFEDNIHQFIKPNTDTFTSRKEPYYCVNHVTGYTVPALDDKDIFKY